MSQYNSIFQITPWRNTAACYSHVCVARGSSTATLIYAWVFTEKKGKKNEHREDRDSEKDRSASVNAFGIRSICKRHQAIASPPLEMHVVILLLRYSTYPRCAPLPLRGRGFYGRGGFQVLSIKNYVSYFTFIANVRALEVAFEADWSVPNLHIRVERSSSGLIARIFIK